MSFFFVFYFVKESEVKSNRAIVMSYELAYMINIWHANFFP